MTTMTTITDTPCVVLSSGGLDSSTLLHHVARDLGATRIYALAIHYGQRHSRELACSAWQCAQLPQVVNRLEIDAGVLGQLAGDASALTGANTEVPDLSALPEAELSQPITYVPNRNMTLLSLAAAYAERVGARTIYYGAQAQDEYGYWDCTAEFVERINALLALNRRNSVQIVAPFTTWRKADVIRCGQALGVDFAHTWTCYRGGDLACRSCPSCVERLRAFAELGLTDPLPYAPDTP